MTSRKRLRRIPRGYWEVKLGLKQGSASAGATTPSTSSPVSVPTTAAQDQAVIPVCIR